MQLNNNDNGYGGICSVHFHNLIYDSYDVALVFLREQWRIW